MLNLIVTAFFQLAFSHGEDHPGPNGGKIQMPGAFHTEVLAQKDKIQIFLLDMNFKNPTVENSTLIAYIKVSDKNHNLNCEKKEKSFSCLIPKEGYTGKLVLKTTRNGAKGNEAIYDWPLK